MTRLTSIRLSGPRRCWRVAILSLGVLALLASRTDASPIREHRINARAVRDLRTWTSFLSGGSTLWSHRKAPPVTLAVRRAINMALRSVDPRSNPLIQYLLWRQERNVARFNYYHPYLGPQLQNLPPPVVNPPPVNPPPDPGDESPGTVVPPPVPEPSTLLISLVLIGTGCLWRYHSGRKLRPAVS